MLGGLTMPATNKYKRIRCTEIRVSEERQRKTFDTQDLEDSIKKRGVIQPIIIDQDLNLIAGERRLRASIKIGQPDIPCRFFEDLSETEAQIIELEENLKRQDLEWRDEVRAIGRIHEMYSKLDPEWNQQRTADELCMSKNLVSIYLRVARDLSNPKLTHATGVRPAWNILARMDDRRIGDAMSDIIEAGSSIFEKVGGPAGSLTIAPIPTGSTGGENTSSQRPTKPPPQPESILNEDFLKWAPLYSGKPFNFIHCDFPYGINLFAGSQSGKSRHESYADSADVYWELCKCLCSNLDKLMTHSAHLMFWLPADPRRQVATLDLFKQLAPSLVFHDKPLVWLKSCNTGIISDPKHTPRHIYETALFAYRDDRQIIQSVGDAYSAPTDKAHHVSTKPRPMLQHFFTMFVDETTSMLDPTCGSGASLQAAEEKKAQRVMGLEINKENFEAARSALRSYRILKKASA